MLEKKEKQPLFEMSNHSSEGKKVSVLIPIYNCQNYVEEAIQSAVNQTYKNVEIILVDDGSSDNSLEIANKYKSEHVKIYSQTNKGAAAARNKCFELSSGELIQYLDADDVLHPEKIKLQVERYQGQNNKKAVINGIWGRFRERIEDVKWETQHINKDYDSPINWLIDSWNGEGMSQTACWLTPRENIIKAGAWNEKLTLNPNDDGEFFCRVLLNSDSILFVDKSRVYYRDPSITNVSQNHSRIAMQSLLNTIHLCRLNTQRIYNTVEVRKALGNKYLNFIYQNYPKYSELTKNAESAFESLNLGKMWPVGGEKTKKLARVLGFKKALRIRSLFKKIIFLCIPVFLCDIIIVI